MRHTRFGIILALLLVSLVACGGEPESPVGDWKAESGLSGRRSRRPFTCGFSDDGTCWGKAGARRATGKWEQDGESILITPDDARYALLKPTVTIDDGVLTVEVAWRNEKQVLIFTRN